VSADPDVLVIAGSPAGVHLAAMASLPRSPTQERMHVPFLVVHGANETDTRAEDARRSSKDFIPRRPRWWSTPSFPAASTNGTDG
jgi:hypothetical protein